METIRIINPSFLEENYAWIDERLRELYYEYALTADNCDEYQDAGLLNERYAWVDIALRNKYYEGDDKVLKPAPLSWVCYREFPTQKSIEDDDESSRERAESDISDYEEEVDRIVQNVIGMKPMYYMHNYAIADEVHSVDLDSEVEDCSVITCCSDDSLFVCDYDVGYDSF